MRIILLAHLTSTSAIVFYTPIPMSYMTAYPVVIIMFLILMFEWAGGLSSVALTDCIQGFVMLLSFIMLPSIIKKNFGGWTELDVETYPQPEFFATPSKETQWSFWQFSLINVSFFTLPRKLNIWNLII